MSNAYNLTNKYKESKKVKDAFEKYNTYKNTNKPNDYSYSDSELLSKTQDKYFNYGDFSYDASNDPAYISSHKNARSIIQSVERHEIIEELVRFYLEEHPEWKEVSD